MSHMNTLFDKASDIIRAASATQRSLYVFCILVTAVLVVLLFRAAPLVVQIGVFVATLLLTAVIIVLALPRPGPEPKGGSVSVRGGLRAGDGAGARGGDASVTAGDGWNGASGGDVNIGPGDYRAGDGGSDGQGGNLNIKAGDAKFASPRPTPN